MKAINSTNPTRIDLDYLSREREPSRAYAKRNSRKIERARLSAELRKQVDEHFAEFVVARQEMLAGKRQEAYAALMKAVMRPSKRNEARTAQIKAVMPPSESNFDCVGRVNVLVYCDQQTSILASCAMEA